ncbi:MAG: NHLP leader peptide family natural product precursor [Desulfobacteraceae bacterium]|nr:NHLP leader peptide family natural product precursor [Desulfobacteraceae bacterium]
MDKNQFKKAYGKLVAKAWDDDDFKAKLLSDPKKIFKENGIEVPENMAVNIVENKKDVVNLVLPLRRDLVDDAELRKIRRGSGCWWWDWGWWWWGGFVSMIGVKKMT